MPYGNDERKPFHQVQLQAAVERLAKLEEQKPKVPREPCCPDWEAAYWPGTDNEAHLALIDDDFGYASTGNGLPPIRFCPWCGAPKTITPPP